MNLTATIIDKEDDLDQIRTAWDALAVEAGRPFCAPAWMLAWWRNARPDGAGLRIVAVREGDRLLGVAPLWVARPNAVASRYGVLTSHLSPPAGPLASPGCEREVAEALTRALVDARPRPTSLRLWDRIGPGDVSGHLVGSWPGRRPWCHVAPSVPVPIVSLSGLDFEDWFATRSSKFRQESRRLRRRLEDTGARFVQVGVDELDRAIGAFVKLHGARWSERGGSNALIDGLQPMLAEAAADLLPAGRMRIFAIEADDRVVAVNLLLSAGDEVGGWNSGFDEDWSRYSPSMQLTLYALADAAERGERRMNLGPGDTGYKRRLADAQEEMAILTLVPRGRAYPVTRLRLIPYQARWALSTRLSPKAKRRLRRLARR